MSLINEALRKARQAASEHDAQQAEDLLRPRRAYPSRRAGRRGGPLVMTMIVIAAAAIGAAAAWWLLAGRQGAPTASMIEDLRPQDSAAVAATPAPSATAAEERIDERATEAVPVAVAAPIPTGPAQPPVEDRTEAGVAVAEPEAAASARSTTETSPGSRVFIMEAEVGGVTLSLGYIVARSTNPFAEINGRDVYVGSEIEGFVVEAIEADRVVLRDDTGPLVLRVP